MSNNRGGSGCLPSIIIAALVFVIWGAFEIYDESQIGLIKNAREFDEMPNYEHYLKKYPTGRYSKEAYEAVVRLWDEMDFDFFKKYEMDYNVSQGFFDTLIKTDERNYYNSTTCKFAISNYLRLDTVYTDPGFLSNLHDKMEAKCRAQYDIAVQINTLDGWMHYLTIVPKDFLFDAQEKYDNLHNEIWGTEESAWAYACEMNKADTYEEYESLYPDGNHFSEAEKRAVDLRVNSIFGRDHGTLPAMNKTGYGGGTTSTVVVENATSYVLTVFYSGNDGKRLVIQPNGRQSVVLTNGNYKIAASVNSSSVRSYAGTEDLTGGEYNVKYYIQTTRY